MRIMGIIFCLFIFFLILGHVIVFLATGELGMSELTKESKGKSAVRAWALTMVSERI